MRGNRARRLTSAGGFVPLLLLPIIGAAAIVGLSLFVSIERYEARQQTTPSSPASNEGEQPVINNELTQEDADSEETNPPAANAGIDLNNLKVANLTVSNQLTADKNAIFKGLTNTGPLAQNGGSLFSGNLTIGEIPASSATASLLQMGSAISGGSGSGTYLGINTAAGFGGNLIDLQVNGSSKYKIDSSGNLTTAGTINGAAISGGSISGGTLTSSSVNGLTLAGGVISSGTWQGSAVGVTYGGTGLSTVSTGDLLYGSASATLSRLSIAADGLCLITSSGLPVWGSCAVASVNLQAAYTNGNTITSSNGRDLSITLTDTATDSNVLINVASGSSGKFAIQNAGTDVFKVTASATTILSGGLDVSSGGLTNTGAIAGASTLAASDTVTLTKTGGSALAATGDPAASTASSLVQIGNAVASGSSSGTFLSVNGDSGYTGDLLHLQVNGLSKFKVDASGNLTQNIANSGYFNQVTPDLYPQTFQISTNNTTSTITMPGTLSIGVSQNGPSTLFSPDRLVINTTGTTIAGTSALNGVTTVTSTTSPQLSVRYDASNYATLGVSSTGASTLNAVGSGAGFTVQDDLTVAPAIRTTGSPTLLTVTGPAHTTLTASTEASDIYFNLARTVEFSAGALATQRAIQIQAPTYAFAGASTITDAATFYISGAPAAGTNATITNPYALWVDGGVARFDGNITVGADQSVKLTGGTSFPASPTEGQMFFRTDTKQLYVYANAKWQADRSTATLIVAASGSQNKEKADYVGDGTNDEVEINAAITALPSSGGVIYLLDGTYNIGATVNLNKANTTLTGAGTSTILKRMYNESAASTGGIVTIAAANNTTVQQIKFDGNKATYSSTNNYGIYGTTNGCGATIDNTSVLNNTVINTGGNGIWLEGNACNLNRYQKIADNIVSGSAVNGIYALYLFDSTISRNKTYNSNTDGISVNQGSRNIIINNNSFSNTGSGINVTTSYSSISGNSTSTNTQYGMVIASSFVTVTGNNISGNTLSGIEVFGVPSNVLISSNNISGNTQYGIYFIYSIAPMDSNSSVIGNTIDSNGYDGIYVYQGYGGTEISGNTITNSGGSGSYSGIHIPGNTPNTNIVGNNIKDTAGTGYAIKIDSGATATYLSNNTYSGTGAASISDSGTGTVWANQANTAPATADLIFKPAGNVGIGTTTPDGKLEIAGNASAAAWGINGVQLQGTAATYTDTSTAGSGTAASAVFTSFAQPTLAATNTLVTTTDAATVYIANAPAAGTNMTLTNPYALWVDAGNVRFDGTVLANADATIGTDLTVTSGARIGTGSTPDSFTALADDSLFVEGALEVDGAARFDGAITMASTLSTGVLTITSTTTPQLNVCYDASNCSTFSTSLAGALTVTPKSGQNLNISLATTGDLAVNTDDLYVDTSTARVGINTATPSYLLDVAGNGTISTASFTGTGLNDMTNSGTYDGSATQTFRIKITTVGTPDKFDWSVDNGVTWAATAVSITGAAQYLANGVSVTFAATTGHTLNDYWTFTATAASGVVNVAGNLKIGGNTVLAVSSGRTNGQISNVFLGVSAGNPSKNTGDETTAIGYFALSANTSGTDNTAVGRRALVANTTGLDNVAIGRDALSANASGNYNTAVGNNALNANTATGNTGIGFRVLFSTTGSGNNALGKEAAYFNVTGANNTLMGYRAGYGVSGNSFGNNSIFGFQAGYVLTTGSNNLLFGYQAGDNLTTGANNIVLGYDIDSPTATNSNTMTIGNLLFGTGLDGSGTTLSTGSIGIGVVTPGAKLEVVSTTEQLRLGYDASNYLSVTTASDGGVTLNATGAGAAFSFSDGITSNGNLTFAGAQKIIGGTATAADLSLQTTSGVGASGADMHFLVGNNGATEALTILNDGSVGIGNISPASLLDAGSKLNVYSTTSPHKFTRSGSDSTSIRVLEFRNPDVGLVGFIGGNSSDSVSATYSYRPGFSLAGVIGGGDGGTTVMNLATTAGGSGILQNDLGILSLQSGSGYGLLFKIATSEKMRIDSAGNVGIGTTGPDRKLDVLDASNPQIRLTTTDGTTYADLQNSAATNLAITGASLVSGSGTDYGVQITPVINQVGSTAGSTALRVSTTETSLGSGTHLLLDLQVGTASKFGITNSGHIRSTQASAPTIGTPTSCGTTPTAAVTAGSTDTAGSFTITAGTGSPGACAAVITFITAYGTAPKSIILTPSTSTGAAKQIYVSAAATTTFTVTMAVAPGASEANSYYYWVIE